MLPYPFTSVTRWLLVVVGCAVLATAQPMSAADEPTPSPRTADTIIYPKNSGVTSAGGTVTDSPVSSSNWALMLAFVLALAGAYVLIQKRRGGLLPNQAGRRLHVEETRALGNRQYLVVANYDGRRFLVGVTPGQIQMLAPLPDGKAIDEPARNTAPRPSQ